MFCRYFNAFYKQEMRLIGLKVPLNAVFKCLNKLTFGNSESDKIRKPCLRKTLFDGIFCYGVSRRNPLVSASECFAN